MYIVSIMTLHPLLYAWTLRRRRRPLDGSESYSLGAAVSGYLLVRIMKTILLSSAAVGLGVPSPSRSPSDGFSAYVVLEGIYARCINCLSKTVPTSYFWVISDRFLRIWIILRVNNCAWVMEVEWQSSTFKMTYAALREEMMMDFWLT